MNTSDMSIEELQELKRTRFQEARSNQVFYKLSSVAREFGKDPVSIDQPGYVSRYGPKYTWRKDGIEIYVDDYGNYMTVNVDGKRVASTHPCDEFIIFGEWLDVALAMYPAAQEKIDNRRAKQAQDERARIMAQIA